MPTALNEAHDGLLREATNCFLARSWSLSVLGWPQVGGHGRRRRGRRHHFRGAAVIPGRRRCQSGRRPGRPGRGRPGRVVLARRILPARHLRHEPEPDQAVDPAVEDPAKEEKKRIHVKIQLKIGILRLTIRLSFSWLA